MREMPSYFFDSLTEFGFGAVIAWNQGECFRKSEFDPPPTIKQGS